MPSVLAAAGTRNRYSDCDPENQDRPHPAHCIHFAEEAASATGALELVSALWARPSGNRELSVARWTGLHCHSAMLPRFDVAIQAPVSHRKNFDLSGSPTETHRPLHKPSMRKSMRGA